MKFSYNDQNKEPREAVAYIDEDGDLRFRRMMNEKEAVAICSDNNRYYGDMSWDPFGKDVKKRFYEGDTITITF